MTNEEILEGNKLIAEFMGGYVEGDDFWLPNESNVYPEEVRYHRSWDWLMPVVEKIEQQYTVKIIRYADECSNVCEIETTEDNPLQITYCYGYDYDSKTKIQVVFDAVVEFIKWHNQNK